MELTQQMQQKHGVKEVYKFYKQTASNPVDAPTLRRVWESFIQQVIENIVLKGKDFNMPSLGTIGVRKQKVVVKLTPEGEIDTRYLRPDWKATKELWAKDSEAKKRKQRVFHLNKHFNGFNCKWYWDKRTCTVSNHSVYNLVMTRGNKRLFAQVIKNEDIPVDYYEQKPKI